MKIIEKEIIDRIRKNNPNIKLSDQEILAQNSPIESDYERAIEVLESLKEEYITKQKEYHEEEDFTYDDLINNKGPMNPSKSEEYRDLANATNNVSYYGKLIVSCNQAIEELKTHLNNKTR